MASYDGKNLLTELKGSAIVAYLKYYATKVSGYWLKFTQTYKSPIGEIYLTSDALYVFRATRKVFPNRRKTGIKIERKDIRGVQLVESDLHLNLTQKGYDAYHKFYKSHFPLYMKNWNEDPDTNSISFYAVDEKEAMKLLEDLSSKHEKKSGLEIDGGEKKTVYPSKLRHWVQEKNAGDAALSPLCWKILGFLYSNPDPDWTRKEIGDNIGEKPENIRNDLRKLQKLCFIKGKKKGDRGKGFWYSLNGLKK